MLLWPQDSKRTDEGVEYVWLLSTLPDAVVSSAARILVREGGLASVRACNTHQYLVYGRSVSLAYLLKLILILTVA